MHIYTFMRSYMRMHDQIRENSTHRPEGQTSQSTHLNASMPHILSAYMCAHTFISIHALTAKFTHLAYVEGALCASGRQYVSRV